MADEALPIRPPSVIALRRLERQRNRNLGGTLDVMCDLHSRASPDCQIRSSNIKLTPDLSLDPKEPNQRRKEN